MLFIRFGLTALLLAQARLRVSLPRSEWMRVAELGRRLVSHAGDLPSRKQLLMAQVGLAGLALRTWGEHLA
ncbi:hypothetical protein D7Y53_09995 [Stenotrophomonas maltophilia]|nr:hypothetical protein [Stenotrophomonas maltophilia]PZP83187.1 MAG: hypothetical protein DI592_08655 [Stenotrophomonas maltophilia]